MKLFIGSDHAGFGLKESLKSALSRKGYGIIDVGAPSLDPEDDYPDFAKALADKVASNKGRGILVCGSGQGICIAANKVRGIRAALAWDEKTARQAKEHLDANILCLPGKSTDSKLALKMAEAWINSEFQKGRHLRRIKKIRAMEKTT